MADTLALEASAKACRFESDLGHQNLMSRCKSAWLRRPTLEVGGRWFESSHLDQVTPLGFLTSRKLSCGHAKTKVATCGQLTRSSQLLEGDRSGKAQVRFLSEIVTESYVGRSDVL